MGQQFTSIAKGLNLGGFQESKEEFLEKGKKAQIGEIREWKGQKFQKQPNGGWIPVKQGTKGSKKEFSAEDEKWLDRFFDPMDTASAFLDSKELEEDYPNKTIKEFERYISEKGQAEDWAVESLVSELHLSNKEATDLFRERNKKLLEEIKKDPEKYGFETEPEKKEGKNVESSFGKLMSKSDEEIAKILQEAVGLKASIWKRGDKQAPSEGDFWISTNTEGVNNGLRKRLLIRPITKEGRERLTDDSVKKKLKKLVGTGLGAWSGRGADGERVFQGYKIWEPDADFETEPEKKEGKSSEVRKDLPKMEHGGDEKKVSSKDMTASPKGEVKNEKQLPVKTQLKELCKESEDGTAELGGYYLQYNEKNNEIYIDHGTESFMWSNASRSEKMEIKEALDDINRKKKAIAGVKDWIGDEASDQEISDVLDAVADFVPLSMLKIQANSPLQFGEKVYDRADEIMEKYREHFDHWDGTDSMPDKQLRKILVAIMYDKRNPRA